MKKFLLIFSLFIVVFSATAQSKGVPVSLSDVVVELQTKFNVSISYDGDIQMTISQEEKQEILEEKTIGKALDNLTNNNNLKYKKLRGDYFVISKKTITSTINQPDEQLDRKITGIVYDDQGKSLPGAMVLEKGSTNAVMSDLNGKFEINLSENATAIVVSFMGLETQEVAITEETYYEIHLLSDNVNIGAVVVSGVAGVTPIKKLTVTIAKIDGKDLEDAPPSSSATSLQGKIPGLTVVSSSGSPGSNTAVRLRGVTSLYGNNSPLIIVDGIMVDTYLSDFNADDIENIEVVKGAAASALYGSKAAGGVIVISTKRGKNISNSSEVTVRNEFGQSQIGNYLPLATHHPYMLDSAYQNYPYTRYANVDYDNDGNIIGGARIESDSGYADQPYALVRDLQREFFKTGNYYTNYVSVATNNKTSNLFVSFENHQKDGIISFKKGYSRKNMRFNADTKIGKYIKLSTSNLLINSTRDLVPGYPFDDLVKMNPDVNLNAKNLDGTPYLAFADIYNNKIKNPYYSLYNQKNQKRKLTFMTNINTSIFVTKWLTLKAKYTVEKLNSNSHQYTPIGYITSDTTQSLGYLYKGTFASTYQTAQATANFKQTFGDFLVKSKISYMYENKTSNSLSLSSNELMVEGIEQFDNAAAASIDAHSYDYAITSANYFAIVDFDYKSKYLFSGLVRRDGSSLFGSNVRWNNYYRVAGAYRISEEFKIPGVQELKIRSAIGTSGLRPGFSYQYETYSYNSLGLIPLQLGNINLKPSEAKEIEFALDAQFLKIFNFTGSYSITNTTDAFVNVPLPAIIGFPRQWDNAATINSTSLEFSLGILAVDKDKTKISFQVNFDKVTQSVTDLKYNAFYSGPVSAYYIAEGEPFGVLYGYKWLTSLDQMAKQLPENTTIEDYMINSDGYVIKKGTEASRLEKPIMLADTNGVPKKVLIGNGNANFNMGFSTNIKIHNISIYFLFDWKNGGDVYNYTKQGLYFENRAKDIDQYGKPDAQKKYTGYYTELYHNGDINSHFIEDGSYVKLREASIFYNFKPKSISNFVKSVRLGIVANNIYTFTKYSGYDPEVAYSGDLTTFAFDWNGYPHYRTISASLQLKF